MAITIESIKEAKQQAKKLGKPVKLSVGDGIRLNVSKSSAVFQLRYRIKEAGKNKERTLTLDKLTARTNIALTKSLNKAIDDAEEAKSLVKQGIDPTKEKRIAKSQSIEKQSLTLNDYFLLWVKRISTATQWSDKHDRDMSAKFRIHISPVIGELPLDRISRQHIGNVLENVADKPATYKKVRSLLNMILEDAVTANKIDVNPTPRKSIGAVTRHASRKLPAVTSLPILQNILAGINRVNITPVIRVASLLQAHTALRSQTITKAEWNEFDLTNQVWRIPRIRGRIKLSDADKYGDHFNVPLSDETTELLTQWRNSLRWQQSDYLFPSNSKNGHITVEALTKVYKIRLKLDSHCAHGWRSSFSTLAHEAIDDTGKALFRDDVIERCLDHVVGTAVTQAYNRGELLELRKSLMHWWSKQLSNTNVAELRKSKTI
jgi:integrase